MITQSIMNWFAELVATVVGLIPPLPAPVATALDGLPGVVGTVSGMGAKFGFIIPWAAMAAAAGTWMACLGISVGIRVVRMIVSHVTGGGGSL